MKLLRPPAYVAGAGALAAVSASAELEELEQTEPSFIQLFTFAMASVCLGVVFFGEGGGVISFLDKLLNRDMAKKFSQNHGYF